MFLYLFNIFLSVLELTQLIIQITCALIQSVAHLFVPPAKKSVEGQIIVVTGAGKGLGRQLALRLAKLDAVLVLWDINKDTGDKVCNEIKRRGGRSHSYQVDVSDFERVEATALMVRREVGDPTIIINNAGILHSLPLSNLTPDKIRRTFEVNLFSHFWVVKCFLPRMIELGRGHIVAIGSNQGLLGKCYCCDYSSTKFGIIGFMESLEDELHQQRKHFINFTVVNPGAINTGLSRPLETRFPKLLPVMEISYASKQVIDAILRNKTSVVIPRGYSVLFAIIRNFSPRVRQMVGDYIGNTVQPKWSED